MLSVGIVGGGTGGPAAATLLARAGHRVTLFERASDPGPVGAGILLQPTGMAVLEELGRLGAVVAQGMRIERLHGATVGGRTVLDLAYEGFAPGLFGLGIHRGALFSELFDATRVAGVDVRCGVAITAAEREPTGVRLTDDAGIAYGPFDLVVLADGARSALRAAVRVRRRVRRHPWGALWAIVDSPTTGDLDGVLSQRYRGTREMVGFLPLGSSPAVAGGVAQLSLFWSVHADRLEEWRAGGLAAWKARVTALDARAAPLLEQVEDLDALLFSAYYDVRTSAWHDDRIVLVGDAAHAMSPHFGQGVNLALVDALVLARLVGDGRDVPGALARYSAARRSQIRFYAAVSRLLTPFFQSDLGLLAAPRDALTRPFSRWPCFDGRCSPRSRGRRTACSERSRPGRCPPVGRRSPSRRPRGPRRPGRRGRAASARSRARAGCRCARVRCRSRPRRVPARGRERSAGRTARSPRRRPPG